MAITGASLQPIYDRLHAVDTYHPMSADTFSDWAMEAGDIVTVSRDGNSITSPVHSMNVVWRGSPQTTINSTGKEERDSISKTSKKKYGRGGGGMSNDQGFYKDLYSEDGRLHSELMYTESKLTLEFEAGIESTRIDFASALEYTASQLEIEFAAGISSTRADFTSALEFTASHLETEFSDNISSLHGELVMTASVFQTELTNTASGLSTRITQNANKVAVVVDSDNNIKAAQIVASINGSTSEVAISADHVVLSGNTSINSIMSVTDRTVYISAPMRVSGDIMATSFTTRNGSDSATISDFSDVIKSASVSGNTLTLTPVVGDPITFSKATTLYPSWSGGTLTVDAKQLNSGSLHTVDTFTTDITTGFIQTSNPGGNYVTAYHADDGAQQVTEITGARTQITLGVLAATPTIVRVLNAGGTAFINNTPTYTIPLTTKSITSDGTFTPGDGYVGFSSVTVNVSDIANAKARFNATSGSYYIEAYDNRSGNAITGSSVTYKLGTSGSTSSTKVQIQNTSGTQIGSTPEISVGSLYTDGQAAVTLNNPTWTNGNPYTAGSTNTVNVTTSGRPTQLTKSAPVTLSKGAWSNGSVTVDITTTNGAIVARTSVTAPTATLTFDCTDLGSSNSGNDKPITATAKHGTATLGTGTQVIHMGTGSWSNGQIGVACRLTDASGKCLDRIYVSMPSTASWTYQYISSSVGYKINCTAGGKTYSTTHAF